jgi:hypothetical protein
MESADTLTIECHPPERRRRVEARMCCGSCCCCCCCLHTLGGIIGAAIAPKLGSQSSAWSHLSLIEYWDEEDHKPAPATGTAVEDEAITANKPNSSEKSAVPRQPMPDIAKTGVSGVKMYWFVTLICVCASFVYITTLAPEAGGGGGAPLFAPRIAGLLILALGFPAIQLVSAIITAIWLALSRRPDRSFQLVQLGKITLGLILGTVAGIVAMVGIWVLVLTLM